MNPEKHASSIALVNLAALHENICRVRRRSGCGKILPVVKADAYGHGAVEVARFLSGTGGPGKGAKNNGLGKDLSGEISMFGVAFLEEGMALRKAGIRHPILLLAGCPITQIPEIVRYGLTPVLFDSESMTALSRYAKKIGKVVNVHIKFDTGMGRIGLSPADASSFIAKVVDQEGICVEGILTHFADADLKDLSFARYQLKAISEIWKKLEKGGINIPYCHIANSAAIMHFSRAHLNLVRPGLMLYGYSPLEGRTKVRLSPVMQVKSRVIALRRVPAGVSISYGRTYVTPRESLIATVSIGYADGYPRLLSNRGVMLAKGKRVPVVGRVCMDMTMLDVSQVPSLSVGDWVTVIGAENKQTVWADEVARASETIPYEILCGIGDRVQRVYLHENASRTKSRP
ncbi:MAG: alanine racemase [Nitrospira sp.]